MRKSSQKPLVIILILILLWAILSFNALYLSTQPKEDRIQKNDTPVTVASWFCPAEPCGEILGKIITSANNSIDCALFELDQPEVIDALDSTMVAKRVVVDYRNAHLNRSYITYTPKSARGYMHNKFCIIDGKAVTTGSFNPSKGGGPKNYNDLLLIQNKEIANLYQTEFNELWGGTFGKGTQSISQNGAVQAHFCPDDDCVAIVDTELDNAKTSIRFMIYSFTHDQIATHLALAKERGTDVSGLMEKQQLSNYSVYKFLKEQGIQITLENTSKLLHFKAFIIDNTTVITGSFNPTGNGAERNDENFLVIHNPSLAKQYAQEYERIKSEITE